MTDFLLNNFIWLLMGLFILGPIAGVWPFVFPWRGSGRNNAFFVLLADWQWFEDRNENRQATAAQEFYENWFPWFLAFWPALPFAVFVGQGPALLVAVIVMLAIRLGDREGFDLIGHSAECYWVGDPRYTEMEAKRRNVTPYALTSRYPYSRWVKLLSLRIKRVKGNTVIYP